MEFLKNRSGKFGIKSLGILFVDLLLFSIFLPSINEIIGNTMPYFSDNPIGTMALSMIPLFILIALSFGIFNRDDNNV